MPGGLKPYLYFVLECGTGLDFMQKSVKSLHIVGDGEHIRKHFTLRVLDKAVVLVLCYIDANGNNHFKNLQR